MLRRALARATRDEILVEVKVNSASSASIQAIARGEYRTKTRPQIRSSGYVVHSLEAALWCFARADTFEAAVLEAANLGGDADTVAAICGQVAGAHYGMSGIPRTWLERLAMKPEITKLADALHEASVRHRGA